MAAPDPMHRLRPSDNLLGVSAYSADDLSEPEYLSTIGERVVRGVAWRAMGYQCRRSLDVSLTPAQREEAIHQVRAIARSSGLGAVA